MSLKIPPLRRGDKIGFVTPAGPVRYDQISAAIERLEAAGYRTELGANALENHGIVSAPAEDRIADLMQFLHDDDVRAIWALRGGYGTVQLFDKIDFTAFSDFPKHLIGFSDLTAFQWAAFAKAGHPSISGLTTTLQMGSDNPYVNYGMQLLAGEIQQLDNSHLETPVTIVEAGEASGWLIGGTLTMICSICGTGFWPRKRSLIVYLEDVNEPLYRIDRCMQQLKLMGFWEKVRAVVLGQFVYGDDYFDVLPLIRPLLPPDIPLVANLPYGHIAESIPLPMGIRARLQTDPFRLSWPQYIR